MSSSTSSFKTELKVVASVVLVLLGVELLMRGVEERLSADIAHIRSADEISNRVNSSPRAGLLLLGNSLTREGILPEVLETALGEDVHVEAYHPDGSSVNEWAYAYRRYFDGPETSPAFLIIGAGRSHLLDRNRPPEDFGAYYCGRDDLVRYFSRHVHDADDAVGFLLARYSVAYTNRHRVQPRVFSLLIPHYQDVLRTMQAKPRSIEGTGGREIGHRNLSELIESARASGTRVAVVAIPMPDPYPLPQAVVQAIADAGAVLVDARALPGIEAGHFPDGYHLDQAGGRILTSHIINHLGPLWWPESSHGD